MPPPVPTSYTIDAYSRANYTTWYAANYNYTQTYPGATAPWGLTGLMTVTAFKSNQMFNYIPGQITLFPGIRWVYSRYTPQFTGAQPQLNGNPLAPLILGPQGRSASTLHQQLIDLIGAPPDQNGVNSTYFVGFSVNCVPWNSSGRPLGYNSTTCNDYWFNPTPGSRPPVRTLPADWRGYIQAALTQVLR